MSDRSEQRAPFAPKGQSGPSPDPRLKEWAKNLRRSLFVAVLGPSQPSRFAWRPASTSGRRPAARAVRFRLETEEWSEGHARIMVPAAGEVDFIAGFKA